jgi:hypothetical protein
VVAVASVAAAAAATAAPASGSSSARCRFLLPLWPAAAAALRLDGGLAGFGLTGGGSCCCFCCCCSRLWVMRSKRCLQKGQRVSVPDHFKMHGKQNLFKCAAVVTEGQGSACWWVVP